MTKERRLGLMARGVYAEALKKRKQHNRDYYLKHRAKSDYRVMKSRAISLKRDEIGNIIY